jgi:subtilase family serine protease
MAGYDGSGQTIVIAGAYAWNDTDLSTFNTQWGLPPLPAGSGQVCTGRKFLHPGSRFSTRNSMEISLDVQYSHGTASGAMIRNYMAATPGVADVQVMYNQIVTDNPGHIVSTSLGSCEAETPTSTQMTNDNSFANGNAKGQSWFAASGDSGSKGCGGSSTTITVDRPANSPYIVGVGGTSATCLAGMTSNNPACSGYGAETTWSGSGGGKSALFPKPSYQTGCNIPRTANATCPT